MTADAAICPKCGGPAKKEVDSGEPQPFFGDSNTSTCPICNTRVGAGDIVCIQCGVNLLTGQKPDRAKEPVPPKRDLQSAATILKTVGIVFLVMICGGALFLLATKLLHDPVKDARQIAKMGDPEEASELLRDHLQRVPEDFEAQFLLGQIYWKGEQYDRAGEAFESIARQGGPRDRDAALLALLASEHISGNENRKRQVTMLQSLIQQRYPDDVELLKVVALLQGVEKEYRGQRDTTEILEAMDAAPPILSGLTYIMTGKMEKAVESLQDAMDMLPKDERVAVALGFVQKIRGQKESCTAVLEQVKDVSPETEALVKMQLGSSLMQRGEDGKALPFLTVAKEARPEDSQCMFLHAVGLQQNKLLDEALVAFEKIASGSGKFAGLASLQMAVIYLEQGNYDQAGSFVRRAGEEGITSARQATVLGRVYVMQGDMTRGEQAYRRAVSIKADYPAVRLELGLLLVNRGSVEEGLKELERYLDLAVSNPVQYRANEIDVLVDQIKKTKQQ